MTSTCNIHKCTLNEQYSDSSGYGIRGISKLSKEFDAVIVPIQAKNNKNKNKTIFNICGTHIELLLTYCFLPALYSWLLKSGHQKVVSVSFLYANLSELSEVSHAKLKNYLFYMFGAHTFYLMFSKIFLIFITSFIIYQMRFEKPYCESYDSTIDNFNYWKFLVPGAAITAFFVNEDWVVQSYLWSFSIWLEAVAIIPQLNVRRKIKEQERTTAIYVATLGCYRLFYLFNWIYKFLHGQYFPMISVYGAIIQTISYAGFLYYSFASVKEKKFGKKFTLASDSFTVPIDTQEQVQGRQ